MKSLVIALCLCLLAMGQDKSTIRNVPQVVYPGTDKPIVIQQVDPKFWQTPTKLATGTIAFSQHTEPTDLTFSTSDGPVVTISLKDGTVTYGKNYTPDEAAKTFWGAATVMFGDRCEAKQAK